MAEYVNGKEMFNEVVLHKAACDYAELHGLELPQMSAKLADAIMQIAGRLATTWNFRNYTYIDEMKSDAILQCIKKIRNFDPEISVNIFAWATQVCWTSFITRIKLEQKQCSIKSKMIREKMSSEFVEHAVDFVGEESNAFVEFLKDNDSLVDYIEMAKSKKSEIHPLLVHRNKTAYKKKEVTMIEELYEVSMEDFEV